MDDRYYLTCGATLPLSEIPIRALGSLLVRCFVCLLFRTQIHSRISGVPLVREAVVDTIGARTAVVVSSPSFPHPLDFPGVEHDLSSFVPLHFCTLLFGHMLYYSGPWPSFVYTTDLYFCCSDLYSFSSTHWCYMYSDSGYLHFSCHVLFRTLAFQLL